MSFEDAESASIPGFDQIDDWAPYSKRVTDGELSAQFYDLGTVSDGFERIFTFRSLEKVHSKRWATLCAFNTQAATHERLSGSG